MSAPRRYVWHRGYVRFDTGMRDAAGRMILDSLTEDGLSYLANRVYPIEGEQLLACRRLWGDERPPSEREPAYEVGSGEPIPGGDE